MIENKLIDTQKDRRPMVPVDQKVKRVAGWLDSVGGDSIEELVEEENRGVAAVQLKTSRDERLSRQRRVNWLEVESAGPYLWCDDRGRELPPGHAYVLDKAHDLLSKDVKVFLVAGVMCGIYGAATFWPEHQKALLNRVMGDAWAAAFEQHRNDPMPVGSVLRRAPNPTEARKLVDDWRNWRLQHLFATRKYVESNFPWSECQTQQEVADLSSRLLNDHKSTTQEHIQRHISNVLLCTLWAPRDGAAVRRLTAPLFDPLPECTFLWACMMLHHCIKEWSSGQFQKLRFTEESTVSVREELNNAWQTHSQQQRNQICASVLQCTKNSDRDGKRVEGVGRRRRNVGGE